MSHPCPRPACTRTVPDHQLACRRHWAQVSPTTQRTVYAAWRRGAGAGTDEHTEAIEAAIAEMAP